MYHKEVILETVDNKRVIYTRNNYDTVKNVSWKDVKLKVLDGDSASTINGNKYSFICHNDNNYLPGSLKPAYQEVGMEEMHIYISFSDTAETFGRHNDEDDVLIVQSIGKMSYRFDNGKTCMLSPGDSLFIPEGVYHHPIIHEPRVTLSFSD